MISKILLRATILLASLAGTQYVHAAPIACPDPFTMSGTAKVEDSTGLINAASACQYLAPFAGSENNVASKTNINNAKFFGTGNWTINTGNEQRNANRTEGTWAISGADFAANDYAIVFKSGEHTNLVAFLFNELYASGVWSTPFVKSLFAGVPNSRAVSHYTIVQRAGLVVPPADSKVPEPGILALMGLGLAGFAAARRRASRN